VPIQVSTVNWALVFNQRFEQKLSGDCLVPANPIVELVSVPVRGTFDPATNSVAITGTTLALRIDNFNAHARAIVIGSLGLKTAGGGAILTGRIQRTRTAFARTGPRRPLLRIKRMTYEAGPFQRKGKDVPDTIVIGGSGHATVMPALARELTRIRCRGPHIVTSRPIRAGTAFGTVQVQLRPDAATTTEQDVTVTVTPTAPARLAGKALRWDLPADLRTPLVCEASYSCEAAIGAQLPLGGGFVLSRGDRSTTVTDLAAAFEDAYGSPSPVVTGTVDGARITVFRGSGTTTEFEDHVSAAFGLIDIRSAAGPIAAHFTKTAAP
jgi:hypothetical protein